MRPQRKISWRITAAALTLFLVGAGKSADVQPAHYLPTPHLKITILDPSSAADEDPGYRQAAPVVLVNHAHLPEFEG